MTVSTHRESRPIGRGRAGALVGALAGAITMGALCSPALAQDRQVQSIAQALRASPVYADRAARPTLSPAETAQIRQEIEHRDPGRIEIAVVSAAVATREGGLAALANALDQRLGAPGTVLVAAGSRVWLVTSYSDTNAATAAVQQAFGAHHALVDQLREAVDGIAAVDPRAGTRPSSGSTKTNTSVFTIHIPSIVWQIIAAAIALPFVIWALVVTRRRWRSRAETRATLSDDLADAREQLVALGDDIRDLDIDVSMPSADPSGKRDYASALDQYQRAERLLGETATVHRVAQASAALAEGRRLMDAARNRLTSTPS